MTNSGKLRRQVARAEKSTDLYKVRNKKEEKQYDRWLSGILAVPMDFGEVVIWVRQDCGKRIIHKGGKP